VFCAPIQPKSGIVRGEHVVRGGATWT
jgi:hypothetical protein